MTLQELLLSRRSWTDVDTIYMIEPWSCQAEVILSNESPDSNGPIIRSGKRYDYFLDGFIACDLIDSLGASAADDVGEKICERLILYAINDA